MITGYAFHWARSTTCECRHLSLSSSPRLHEESEMGAGCEFGDSLLAGQEFLNGGEGFRFQQRGGMTDATDFNYPSQLWQNGTHPGGSRT